MATLDKIKKIWEPWFKERGFISNSRKRLWFYDCGFYLIIAEIVPCHGWGYLMEIAVKFLWTGSPEHVTYDYGGRVYGQVDPNPTMGAIFFDSPTFDEEVAFMMKNAEAAVKEYQMLRNKSAFASAMYKEKKANDARNADYYYFPEVAACDCVMISEVLSGRRKNLECTGKERISCGLKSLAEYSNDPELFKEKFIEKINEARRIFAEKTKIKLQNEISDIFDD